MDDPSILRRGKKGAQATTSHIVESFLKTFTRACMDIQVTYTYINGVISVALKQNKVFHGLG